MAEHPQIWESSHAALRLRLPPLTTTTLSFLANSLGQLGTSGLAKQGGSRG
jgi:hypothetical protein